MADLAWPGEDPLGKRFSFFDEPPSWLSVVGVVGDVRQWGPERPPLSQAYFPFTRGWPTTAAYLVVRAEGEPTSLVGPIRRALLAVDPTQPPSDIRVMEERLEGALALRRFYTALVALFATAAILLAAAGIYGTVSFFVTRRVHEMGIRMALGAGGRRIVGLVLGRGLRLVAWGVGLGLLGVWAATSVVDGFVYGVAPTDLPTLAAGCLVLAAAAAAASTLPAVRALRVPPVIALRSE
jgi:predicted lysophospholipase L1 biosynthesis ABC-type transport system permease subunit